MSRFSILTVSILLSIITITSCQIPIEEDMTIYPKVSSYQDAAYWMALNIEYELDSVQYGTREYWALPEETMQSRKGDCEDKAALFIAICKVNFDREGVIHIELTKKGTYHAFVVIDSYVYGFIDGGEDTGKTITFSEYCENAGDHYADERTIDK